MWEIQFIKMFSGYSGRLGNAEASYGFCLDTRGKLITCFARDGGPEPTASQQPDPHPALSALRCPRRCVCALRFPKLRPWRRSSRRAHSRLQCRRKSVHVVQTKGVPSSSSYSLRARPVSVGLWRASLGAEIHLDMMTGTRAAPSCGLCTTCGHAHQMFAFFCAVSEKTFSGKFDLFWIPSMLTDV